MVSCLDMRRLAALFTLVALPALAQHREEITVARILIDVRVTNAAGDPITGLNASDFTVTIGNKKTEVLSATWIDETSLPDLDAADPLAKQSEDTPPAPQGRLFVYYLQSDFARNERRVVGHMHFMTYADDMLEMLGPHDRVAVFSFDSHLKFRLDFSSDKEEILAAMRASLVHDQPPPPRLAHSPSLGSRLDREEMKRVADSESALLLLGNALRNIPGPKTLVLMGWGLGEMFGGAVRMRPKYALARQALDAARVTIFSLDTTSADYHSLEVGLSKAAEDTGGFYAKTHVFPAAALDRLERTLSGHYELELRRPEGLNLGAHPLVVKVKRRGAIVLAPGTWMDR